MIPVPTLLFCGFTLLFISWHTHTHKHLGTSLLRLTFAFVSISRTRIYSLWLSKTRVEFYNNRIVSYMNLLARLRHSLYLADKTLHHFTLLFTEHIIIIFSYKINIFTILCVSVAEDIQKHAGVFMINFIIIHGARNRVIIGPGPPGYIGWRNRFLGSLNV